MRYVIAPVYIIDEMEKLREHQVSGTTAVIQKAALAGITVLQDCADERLRECTARSGLVHNRLNKNDEISCLKLDATFYAFPNIHELGFSAWELS